MYLDIFARLLLVLGGLNYLYTAMTQQKNETMIVRLFMLSVGLSALYFLFDRDFYLPFLGKVVFPVAENQQTETKDLKPILLKNLPPNTHVVFWAAKRATASETSPNPFDAYSDYANSGVAKTNEKGEVTINIACPVSYNVRYKRLRRHLHYRYELPRYRGMFSRVHTHFLESEC
jgi:hypothetical protein